MPDRPRLRDIRDFVAIWLNEGLPSKAIAPVVKAVKRMDELDAELAAAIARVDNPLTIAADLAAGRLTVQEAAEALVSRNAIHSDAARGLITEAQVACYREAWAFIRKDPQTLAEQGLGPRGWLEDFGLVPPPPEPVAVMDDRSGEVTWARRNW
jgi:hypothetical protein